MIAPSSVEFHDQNWSTIGTKVELSDHLAHVTGIDTTVLEGDNPHDRTISERMSWAASRTTSRIEDAAYCLMGLFDVFMPMLYGEGIRAFTRLQEEILRQTEDYTMFAWKASFLTSDQRGVLARSPEEFIGGKDIEPRAEDEATLAIDPPALTSRGILVDLPTYTYDGLSDHTIHLAWVGSKWHWSPDSPDYTVRENMLVCIAIRESQTQPGTMVRVCPDVIELVRPSKQYLFPRKRLYLKPFGNVERSFQDISKDPHKLVADAVSQLATTVPIQEFKVIQAPTQYIKTGPTIFLSGSIDSKSPSWRDTLSSALSDLPVTILNPVRKDWDSSWIESMDSPPFAEQVNWELEGMKNADVVAFYFGAYSQAPIALLELGLHAASGRCVVACPKDYWKRGNVQAVCELHGVIMLEDVNELTAAVIDKLKAI